MLESLAQVDLEQLSERIGLLAGDQASRAIRGMAGELRATSAESDIDATSGRITMLAHNSRDNAIFIRGMRTMADILADPSQSLVRLPSGESVDFGPLLEAVKPGITNT